MKTLILMCALTLTACAGNPDRDDSTSKALQAQRSGYNEGYNDALRQQQATQQAPRGQRLARQLEGVQAPAMQSPLPLPGLR